MANISVNDLEAWTSKDSDKLDITTLDANRESMESNLVISRLNGSFDTTLWVDPTTTPVLVRTVISMNYVADYIDSTFLDMEELNAWASLLRSRAETLLQGIISGAVILTDLPVGSVPTGLGLPDNYPNDMSSSQEPTLYDTSLGDAKFSMGRIF